ncbi:MAG: 50S ribosomal protein L15 [Planctomycetota bacterium]
MNLNDVNEGIEKFKKRKRLGRGTGSGLGKTSGRGHKGQKSRSGHSQHPTFQGGAMPMIRRIAKRGFNNKFALKVGEVNVGDLEKNFNDGDEITPELLKTKALANYRYDVLKVLGKGEITKKVTISAHRFSKSAREKIEKAGGTIVELPGKKPVVKNKMNSKKG